MKDQSRRQFIKSCLVLTVSGTCLAFVPLYAGCGRNEKTPGKANISSDFEPAYLKLHGTGELKKRGEELWRVMEKCRLCPRECGVNRLEGERGFCQASSRLQVSAYHSHFGEERSLVGTGGSGAIFFTHCGLRCVFCINWEISQEGEGTPTDIEQLAAMMLHLQETGCHNINVVTPTHYSAHILLALDHAATKGLGLPLVYNTCGWERLEILKTLDGIVDIYLPDFKYSGSDMAVKFSSGASTYPEVTKAALREMHRQVGVARPARDGIMYRGLMIRHLVMPNDVSGTRRVMEWIGQNLPGNTYVNIMSQYKPVYKANRFPEISRRINAKEYHDALEWAGKANLTNLDVQGSPL